MAQYEGEIIPIAAGPGSGGESRRVYTGPVIPTGEPSRPPEQDFTERAISRAGMGALGGAIAPEFLRVGGGIVGAFPHPIAKSIGSGMQAAATALKPLSQRLFSAATGGAAGVVGEAVETGVSAAGYPKIGVVAGLGSEFITQAGPGAALAAVRAIPGGGSLKTKIAKDLLEEVGITRESLSEAQQKIFDKEIEILRGKLEQGLPQRGLFGALQSAVNNIQAEAARKTSLMEALFSRSPGISSARLNQRAAEISKIGNTNKELSEVAGDIRSDIVARFSEQGLAQNAAYKAQKKIVDDIVAEKEKAGVFVESLREYKEIVKNLDQKLLMNKIGLYEQTRKVSVPTLVNNLKNIREALVSKSIPFGDSTNPANIAIYNDLYNKKLKVRATKDLSTGVTTFYRVYPTAYEAIDALRRKLGDAAWKEGVEGFESLSREEARNFYSALDNLQSKYVGTAFDKLQEGYSLAAQLLDKYKGGVGAKATGLDKFDPAQFAKTDKSLVTTFFGSKNGVEQLVRLTGNQTLVEQAASDYAARSLADLKSADQMRKWVAKNSDLLSSPYLAGLKDKINSSITNVANIERKSAKTLNVGESARKQAGEISRDAEKTVKTILGDVSPQARVRDIILGGKKSEWDQIAPILAASPEGRQALSDSLNQVLADAAKTGRKSLPLMFRDDIAPFVEPLIGPEKVKQLQLQLNKLAGRLTPEKITTGQKALSAAIATSFGAASKIYTNE